jgi:glycosyltransferase involved in cell wall biosynthesis
VSGRRVSLGVLFYPRGGSAQVVRYLSAALERAGWSTSLASGSLGPEGASTNASTFYARDDLVVADYSEALRFFEQGDDPMRAPVPFHPSYEDRLGVPDRVLSRVSPVLGSRQVEVWHRLLAAPAWSAADLYHLHHLTPQQLAVLDHAGRQGEVAPPLLVHLHGTELKFLDRVRQGEAEGHHGTWWFERLTDAARRADHVVCISEHDRELALDVLDVEPERVSVMPNGVDTSVFDRFPASADDCLERWRRWFVDEPLGWDESGRPGSIRYTVDDLAVFAPDGERSPVILYVGRFLDFKRVPLLVRAYARARPHFATPAPLVIWGGAPGEWEGDHPHTVATSERVDDTTFFVGWRGHDELPTGLACADVMAAPSTDEPFGQVFLEAMAAGVPVITTSTGGPLGFVNVDPEPNGWLVPPDDVQALADALVVAVNDRGERERRAENAYTQIRRRFAWSTIAEEFVGLYEQVLEVRGSPPR